MGSSSYASYVLAVGDQDRERLVILNELFNPSSLRAIQPAPGLQILTIGCGISLFEAELAQKIGPDGFILTTDISSEQLAIAEQYRMAVRAENLTFMKVDATDVVVLDQLSGPFDRIHCRFVLTHLPWEQVQKIVPALYRKLAPGAVMLLEELLTIKSNVCEPRSDPGYDLWNQMVIKQLATQKSDTCLTLTIEDYLKQNGYQFERRSFQPILRTPREKSILRLGVHSIGPKLLAVGCITAAELEEASFYLEQL